ncbi:stalk domain-containing protein [Anaerotignum sp.]|uniref:stalk domain-containing protein n=1 Tax=Anaerotignum sp. TaxID=2039241 RepID=UPI0028998649|nr:stalk domain-containing protein [Anaerotignum sp.]
MKKFLKLFFAITMALSVSVTPVAAKSTEGKSNVSTSQKETKEKVTKEKETKEKETESAIKKTNDSASSQKTELNSQTDKKVFKNELNEQKKELQQEKASLNQQLEELKLKYESLIASGDTEGAKSVLENINALNQQIQEVQAQMKETINERYMLVKTMYTDEELAEFTNAKELISKMYADAEVLSAGSVTINNNLIKFDTPAYIKNGVTLVPLRAISEALGGEVSWDGETQTIVIKNGDTVVQITANSTTATVNGESVKISAPPTKNCGRTYVPLRFLAETLGFNTEWDSENEQIEIRDDIEAPSKEESTNDSVETSPEVASVQE